MTSETQTRGVDAQEATYLAITSTFLTAFGAFIASVGSRRAFEPRATDLVLLGLASQRLGRLVAFDRVAQPERQLFTRTVEDASGAGETVVATGRGARRAIGELLSCPVCIGTWSAAALTYALHLAPGPARIFITILAASGLAELSNSAVEAMSWSSRAARTGVGERLSQH
jgi:Protein of unknown function (DUF1360)